METTRTNILVVDDEQRQLDTVCRGLRLFGYRCVGVLGADPALTELAVGAPGAFDLLLTDLTMPGRSGLALIGQVRARHPDLPILVVTGLAATPAIQAVRRQGLPLLPKPFSPSQLDAAIRAVLAR